jgi:hypothetical protein
MINGTECSSRIEKSMGSSVYCLISRYQRLKDEETNHEDGLYTNSGHNPNVNPDIVTGTDHQSLRHYRYLSFHASKNLQRPHRHPRNPLYPEPHPRATINPH